MRRRFHRLHGALSETAKIRSSPYVFGGPVVPCYLEAIGAVIDILRSSEYEHLRSRLDLHIRRLTRGLSDLGLTIMGGATPIVSVLIGDEAQTLRAGKFLFDRGYFVQSVLFPAVPYHCGVLRVQCNANHDEASIDGLIAAFADLAEILELPDHDEQRLDGRRTRHPRKRCELFREVRYDVDIRRARSDPDYHADRGGSPCSRGDPAL